MQAVILVLLKLWVLLPWSVSYTSYRRKFHKTIMYDCLVYNVISFMNHFPERHKLNFTHNWSNNGPSHYTNYATLGPTICAV